MDYEDASYLVYIEDELDRIQEACCDVSCCYEDLEEEDRIGKLTGTLMSMVTDRIRELNDNIRARKKELVEEEREKKLKEKEE